MKTVLILSSTLVFSCSQEAFHNPIIDYAISAPVLGSTLTIHTDTRYAGAIDSLVWDNTEFVNSDSRGSMLQTAMAYDGLGECLNPTEAGSANSFTLLSDSLLLIATSYHNVLQTKTQMAYWLRPGTPYPHSCASLGRYYVSQNTTVLSQDTINKTIRILEPNIIEYDIVIHVNEYHDSGTFEVLTGYMPPQFYSFYMLCNSVLVPVFGSQEFTPMVFTSLDGAHAMGVYSPSLREIEYVDSRIEANTIKWGVIDSQASGIRVGDRHYTIYLVIGSLEQVKNTLVNLTK